MRLAEGRRTLTIQHRAIQGGSADDGGAYDNLPLPGVTVDVIDNDTADVLIAQTGVETLVNEHPATGPQPVNATDIYKIVLTKQPLTDVTIELKSDGESEFYDGANGAIVRTLTFRPDNWFIPQDVTVRAHDDLAKEGIHFSRLTHNITSLLSNYFGLLDADVVAGLIATINGNADTLVTAVGHATKVSLATNEIELSGPAFKLNNASNVRTTFVNGDKAYTTANVALSGAVADGVRWTLNLNGVDFSYIAKPGDDLAKIADGLKTVIGSTYTVNLAVGASNFTVTRADSAAFSVALTRLVPTTGAVATAGGTLGGVQSADFYQRAVVSVNPSAGAIADGDAWSLTIDGTAYRYVAGAHKELRQPASIDVRIADDEAPSVLFSQSNGSTNVTEASDLVVLGGGFVTQTVTGKKYVQITAAGAAPQGEWKIFLNGSATPSATYVVPAAVTTTYSTIARELAGQLDDLANITARYSTLISGGSNIIVLSIITDNGVPLTVSVSVPSPAVSQFVSGFRGDFGTSIVREVGTHDSIFNAQDLELGRWSTNTNPDVENSLIPHLSVLGTGDGNSDFYRFRITDDMLKLPNGQPTPITAYFDIDRGYDAGDTILWNSIIRLYDQDGRLIAQGPAGSNPFDTVQSGSGSTTFADDFLSFTFNTKGVYYLEIDNALGFGGLPTGIDYTLQVSVPNHPVAGFVFAPEAIGEVGLHDTIFNAQSVDPRLTPASEPSGTNFFTFFDPNVGNAAFGGSITSATPYVRVQGSGDGNFDVFQFEVTDAMLNPPSHTAFGTVLTPDTATYYKKVVLMLTGEAVDGDVWTLKGLRGRDYTYVVGSNPPVAGQPDTLANIAQRLFAQLPARFLGNTTIGSSSFTSGVGGTAAAPMLTIVDDAGFTFTGLSREIQHAGDVARTTKVLQSNGTAATFSTVDITLANLTAGNVNAGQGDRWTVKLGAQTFFFDVPTTGTTTLESVAAGLAAKINTPAVGFTATPTVGTNLIHITTTGADFGVEITVSGENPDGYATLSGTPTPSQRNTIAWTSATFVINGPVRPGEDWKITLTTPGSTPTTNTTHYTAQTGDNAQDIATQLAANLTTGGYTATAKGNGTAGNPYRVQIDRAAVFTTDFSLTASGTGTVASTPTSVLLALSGSAFQGEVWSIVVNSVTLGTYLVGATAASQTLDAVIDDLVSDINTLTSDNFVARKEEGNRIVLTKTNGGSFTATVNVTAPGTITVDNETDNNNDGAKTIVISGTAHAGETWNVVIDTTHTYPVTVAANATINDVVQNLTGQINGTAGYTAVAVLAGSTWSIHIARLDGAEPIVSVSVNLSTVDSAAASASHTVTLLRAPQLGDTWTLDLSGVAAASDPSYTIAAPGGNLDSLNTIANGLNADLPAGFTATVAGNAITITRTAGTFTVTASLTQTTAVATVDSGAAAASHVVTLTRLPVFGAVWTLDISGTTNDPTHTVAAPGGVLESLHDIAVALSTDLPTGFTASVVGNAITINRTAGTFTVTADVDESFSTAISNPTDVAYLTFAGTPHPGDTWAITIGTSNLVVQVTTETQASEVAANFAEQINRLTGFIAGTKAGELSVIKTSTTDFTVSQAASTVTAHRLPDGSMTVFNPTHVVELTGPVVAGETWSVTINGLPAFAPAVTGTSLQTVAENLASAINLSTGLRAQAIVSPTDGTKWRLYIGSAGNAPPVNTVTASTTSAAGTIATLTGGPDTSLVTVTGNPLPGEVWTIRLNGIDHDVPIVAQNQSQVVTALTTALTTGAFVASSQGIGSGRVIVITNASAAFTLLRSDASITPVEKFVAVPATATPVDTVQMTISVPTNGAVNQDDRWTITLGTNTYFVDAAASETTATMAVKLANKVNADSGVGFAAVAQGSVIYFSRIGTTFLAGDPSLSVTLAPTHGDVTISGAPKLDWDQAVTLRTAPDVIKPNDQWLITIGVQTLTGTADADPTYAEVALALATDARSKGFTAPNPGADDVVHIRNSNGAALALGSVTRPFATAHLTFSTRLDSLDDPATVHYKDVSATLAGEFQAGDRWTLTFDNQTYYYEVPTNALFANQKLTTIAQGFVDLINGGVPVKTIREGGILAGESQSIYSLASSGKIQFSFRESSAANAAVRTTAAVNYNATAAEVQAAFNALTLTNGNQLSVSVTGAGTLGNPWQVTFLNPGNVNVPLLTGKLLLADGTTAAGNPFHVATLDTNATIKINDRQLSGGIVDDPFRFDVSRGGSVHVVLDIDKSALVTDFPFFGSFGLTVSPTIELLSAAGDVLAADDIGQAGHQVIVDAGSGHDRDPFIDFEITRAGVYFVRVGSYFDFEAFDPANAPYIPPDFRAGVYPGQSYELNMSVENHPTNPNALALEGKILTIIDGTGRGQTAKITAYDPQTRQFTLDRLWTTAPDATSQFEISYHISEEGYTSSYTNAPTTDSYTATLSRAPTSPVTLNIRPELTRTFNSDFSFDALLNNGRNEAVQVRTATNRTKIELHDTVVAGEVWTVMLTRANAARATHATELPETFSYVAQAGDSLATIATALAQKIGETGRYKAVANLGAITITATTGAFFTEFTITRGGAAVTATRNGSGGLTSAVVTLTGQTTVRTPTPEVWKLTLDGIDLNYQVNVGDTLNDIAAGLAAALKSADYTVGVAGSVLTVSRVNGAAFSLAFTVTADRNGAQVFSVGPKNAAGQLTTATVEFLGRPTIGTSDAEIWKLIVDNTELRYAVRTGDTLTSVVAGLEAALRASPNLGALYNVTRAGTSLTLSRIDGAGFETAVVVTPNHENSAIVTSQLLFAPTTWGSLTGVLNGAGAPGALAAAQEAYYVDTTTNETYIRAGDAWILLKRWNEEQTVFVEAIDDTVADGSDALVVPAPEERVNAIRGPLIINGNIGVAEDAFLNDPFRLPGETNFPLPDGRIITFTQTTGPRDSFTDIFALHTTPQFGERPGLDPRINTSLYNLTFLDGGAATTAIDLTAVSKNILTVDNRTPFSVAFAPSALVTFSGVPTAASVGSINWLNVSVTLNGVPSNNERWDVTVGSQTYKIRTTTLADADLADVDALLARLVATTRDTLSQDLWDGFSAQSRATLADVTATTAAKRAILVSELNLVLTNGASIYNSNRFALGQLKADTNALRNKASLTEDETILLNRLLLRDGFGTTAGSAIGENTTTMLELANKLRAALPSDYRFDFLNSVFGNRLIISRNDGVAFAFNFVVGGNSSIIPKVRGTPDQNQVGSILWTQASWRFAAGAAANSTVTYAGKTYSPLASTETNAVARLVDGLAKAINADPDPLRRAYLPSVTGDTITLKQPVVTAFTATVGAGLELTGTALTLPNFDRVQIKVTAAQADITVGRVFTVTLGGTAYTYAARAGDRAADVLLGLSAAIPASYLPTIENGALIAKSVALGGSYFYAPVNLNTRVNEADQVDILNVFNGDSPADDIGVLTEDRITGLGMGGKAIVGEREFDGGITYSNLEVVNVRLGSGADNFTVESTHRGLTTISGAKGDDTITVKTILGHTVILGGDDDDTVHLLSDDLVIDQLSGMLVVDGQSGDDVLNVHDNSSIAVLITDHAGILSVRQPLDLAVLATNGRYALRSLGFGLPLADSAGITRFNGYADATLNFSMHAAEIDQALEALFGVSNLVVGETRTTDTAVFTISSTDVTGTTLLWTLTVRNVAATPGNTGTLTGTSITGLNLFTLSEVQRFTVQAKNGKYVLRAPGYGDVTLDYTATAADVQAALRTVYGTVDLDVTAVRTTGDVTYTVTFARTTAGQNFGQLLWLPSALSGTDLSNVGTLATALRSTTNPVVQVLRSFFSQATNDLIDNVATPEAALRAALVEALNDVISGGRLLYDQASFAAVTLRPETRALLARNPGGSELSRLNRLLLTDAFATILDTQLVPNENASAIITTSTLRDGSTVPGLGVTSQQVLNIDATAGYFRIGFRLDAAAVTAIQHGVALMRDGSFVIDRTYVPEIKANNTVWTAAIPFNADADLFRLYLDPILNPANSDLDLPHTHNFDVVRTAGAFVLTLEGAYRTLSIQPTDIDRAPLGFTPLAGTLALPAQTLAIKATGGTFRIGLELTPGVITFTQPIAYNASADAVLAALNPLVNPANATTPLTDAPQTANVAVTKQNNVYTIIFQGQFANLRIDPVNVDGALLDFTQGTTSVRGTATLSTQIEGIYYYDLATLNIDLSAGSDIFNIRGSAAGTITNVRGHDGDDRFYVSSQADRRPDNLVGYDHLKNIVGYNYLNGTLNDVKGTLNLDGGTGRQTLMISDEAATAGDPNVSITDTFTGVGLPNAEILVRGLAVGDITFGANLTDGNFANGITIWSGFGNDTIAIDGTLRRDGLRTVTTLNTGLGNDRITASLTAGEDDFFVLNTQGAYHNQPAATDNDIVDGSASTLPLIVFGGQGNDDITGGHGDDLLFGDRGQVIYRDGAVIISAFGHAGPGDFTDGTIRPISAAFTEYASIGGNDTIRGREGRDLIFGGAANDTLYGFDANLLTSDVQSDVLVGDSGLAQYRNGVLVTIETIAPSVGGNDTLHSSLGANVLIGGAANDTIHAGGDGPFDVALGDNARVTFDATTGLILRAETIDPTIGGADIIDGGDSGNVIFGGTDGGTGFDEITTLNPTARNYVIGDNGEANFDLTGKLIRLLTNTPAVGGIDHITTGGASDLIAGGVGADVIHAGAGNDFVLGDNGIFEFAADGVNGSLDWFASTDPTDGGADTIFGEAGEDYLFGGTAGDTISGGLDHDVILGDHGRYDKTLQINQNFVSIFITNGTGAGNDVIHGDEGDDFILGQQGDDRIFGGAGNDDLTGGHNVLFGADGNDYIDGGDEADVTAGDSADVILGDNGVISREVLPGTPSAWRTYPAPFASIVIRTVVRFDDIDLIAGNDTLLGDAGQDILHGQRGSDVIDGGAGDDEVYGELGADTVTGGDGNDVVLGDVGLALRAFNADGTPRLDGNGSWHRDIFLEDVGRITGVIRMDQMPLRLDDPALAAKLLGADLAVLGGSFLASGAKQFNTDNGAWNTELILIDLVPADNDRVSGGAGDDLLFGQRGSDTLNGGAGNDVIFADGAFNSVPFGTTLPQIVSGVRLIGSVAGTPYELAVGGSVIVPNLTMQPLEFGSTLPQLTLISNQAFGDLAAADGLRRTDGATTMPLLSFVPDLINHADVLPGNDIIDGGAGADTIYADDFAITLPLFTGLAAVDQALADVQSAVVAVNSALHALSLDYDLLQHLIGAATGPHDIRVGNDTILGGDGNDTIAGDNALITIPFAAGVPGGSADFTTSALRFHSFLRDLEYVAGDFVNATQEAHLGVLRALVDDAVTKNPTRDPKLSPAAIDPNFHHLFIGNDNIDGGFGNDVITGDQTATVISVLPGRNYSNAASALGVTTTMLSDTNAALSAQQTLRGADLIYHRATHVGDWSDRTPDTTDLRLIPAVFEYDLDTGNDTVRGGAGNDLLIGDQSVFILPLVTTTRTPIQSEVDISLLVADLTVRLTKPAITANALFGASALGHAGGNRGVALRSAADVMTGDAGNDVIFSKRAAVVVPIATTTGQPAPLDLGLSRVETSIAFPGQANLSAGRTVTVVKDSVVDRSGTNALLVETGNVARPVIKQTRDLIFGAMAPQVRTLITEIAATSGVIVPSGDGSVLPPGGSVVRAPTLGVAITVPVPAAGSRIFTLGALLDGVLTSDRFSAVWQILDAGGVVVASGVGAQQVFNAPKAGEYRARVVVTDLASGAFGIAEATLRVNTVANTINAGLTGPTKVVTGQVVTFNALLNGKPAGGNYNVSWQVFDSTNLQIGGGLGATLGFTAGAAGVYKVQVTFTDAATNITETTSALLTVIATPASLNVAITGPATGVRGALLTFEGLLNGTAAALNGSATWFVLDRKNAIVATGSGPQFAFVPPALGNYTVQFQMVDPVTGLLGIATAPLTIPAPVPTFSVGINGPLQGIRGQQITLTTLVNGTTLPAGYTAAWQIVNNVSTAVIAAGVGESFTFNPAAVGAYTVQLKLTETATGAVGTATSSLVITSPELTFTVGLSGPSGGETGRILTFGGLLNGRAFDGNYVATWRVLDSTQTVRFTTTGREISFAPVATIVAPATTETFTVEFTLVDAVTGQTGKATLPIAISAAAGATAPQQTIGLSGPTIALSGQTLDYSVLIDGVSPGGTNHIEWSVFDSTNTKIASGSGAAFHYVPATAGTVRVQVELQNTANQVLAFASTSLVLSARPPVISAGVVGPVTGVRGQLLTYQALLGAGAPVGFTNTWQVLDAANAIVASGAGDQFIFSSPIAGQFRVRFTLADNAGAGISAVTAVNVTAATSVMDVNFTGPVVGTRGQTLDFAALLEGGAIPAGLVTTWTVRNAAGAVVATNVGERLTFVPAVAGRFTVNVSIADPLTGAIGLASAPLSVSNDAPSLTVAITGPLVVPRGQTVTFTGAVSGGALPADANAFWNITDDHNAVVAQGLGTQLAFRPFAAGRYVVRFTVANPVNGAFGTSDVELNVTSDATVTVGTVAISGPAQSVAGQTLHFAGVLNGKAIIGDYETVWRVLDEGSVVVKAGEGHAVEFTPGATGNYTVELALKDRLTGAQTVVTAPLLVSRFLTIADPTRPGNSVLIVGGTVGNDLITFTKATVLGSITLSFEQKTGGAVKFAQDFALISRVEVYGGLGDDTITVAPQLDPLDAMLDGGAGRDVLNGGAGNDVLLGGFGDDTLSGGPGADRLDGGLGSDQVRGGEGADFLLTTGGSDQLFGDEGADTLFAQPLTPGARVTLDGGAENDRINIPATNGASITVKPGAGVNAVNLGSSAGVLSGTGGTVDGLRGRIDITAGALDIVNLDDSASIVARNWNFGSGMITGFAGAGGSIALHGVGFLNAALGSGDDRVTFAGSAAATTNLRDSGGSETIIFASTDAGSTTNLVLGSGVNRVDFGGNGRGIENIRGNIAIGGSGADLLTFDDSISKAGRTLRLTSTGLTGSNLSLTYTGFASLTMKLGAGADVLTIDNTAAIPVTIETGLGNDKVTIRATSGPLSVDLGLGGDTLNLGSSQLGSGGVVSAIAGAVTLIGGTAPRDRDTFNIDNSGTTGATVGMLTLIALTGLGLGAGVTYSGFEAAGIRLGSGNDTFTLGAGTAPFVKIDAGGGSNTIIG